MCTVTLVDGTIYYIDTEDTFNARCVVEYKLRDRADGRKILTTTHMKGVTVDVNSGYYNSGNQFDRKDLKCASGWSYKWK